MTVEELHDEISAIDAIYPGSTVEIVPQVYNLKVPQHEDLEIQLSFLEKYPDEVPNVIQVINNNTRKYTDAKYLESQVRNILQKIFRIGEVCIFELFTELEDLLEKYSDKECSDSLDGQETLETHKKPEATKSLEVKEEVTQHSISKSVAIDPLQGWTQSEPILDRGSTFIGYARHVDSVEEAEEHLNTLVTDKKIAKATHNISSWRIKKENGVQYQDCDDDGETAAGGRLLHLLTVCIFIIHV